jgi:hypothetical protein
MNDYRINGFEQIKALYSIVFSQKYDFTPHHISLYVFLINQNNRNEWVEWFKCPYDLAMAGACIGNKKTYYKCLNDLQEWKLLKYEKGVNEWKAPKIKLEVLKSISSVPQSVPQVQPLPTTLPEPLPTTLVGINKDNLKPKTKNLKPKTIDFNFKKSFLNLGVEENIINDWLKVRKAKKGVDTETSFNSIKKEIELSGITANTCIKIAVERNWVGFKYEWIKNINNSGQKKSDYSPSPADGFLDPENLKL